jgi:glycosyltransferase involved in cell wall biosynthesis
MQPGSGIEQVILELAGHLRTTGQNTDIVTYRNGYGECAIPITEFRVPLPSSGDILSPFSLLTTRAIRNEIKDSDLIVTSLYPMNLIPLLPKKISRVAFIEWGIQPYGAFDSWVDKSYLWLLDKADRYAIQKSDRVLVSSTVTQRWVESQGVRPGKLKKLNLYGLNFNRLGLSTDHTYLYHKHPELEGADGIILYVGRQSPHKNIELLIDAISILKNRGRNVKLLVVGRESFPKYARYLRTKTGNLNLGYNVLFPGLVSESELAGYYNLCDIFVNASRWEGYLNPEPYAFKKPIIAYNVPPHEETVRNGVTGLLSRLSPCAFASHIDYLLSHKAERLEMGEAGYRWAREFLDYTIVARNFLKAVEE